MKRPWSGQVEATNEEEKPDFDPTNPLCPGKSRSGLTRGQSYELFTSLYLETCEHTSFLESLVVTIGFKLKPLTLVFTFKYKLL